jgi:hypothetical protein
MCLHTMKGVLLAEVGHLFKSLDFLGSYSNISGFYMVAVVGHISQTFFTMPLKCSKGLPSLVLPSINCYLLPYY